MRKKGFTLVELLAVIIVLGLLAVITTPLVLSTIESSKRNSFESSAKNTIDAGSLFEANEQTIPPDGLSVKDLDIKSKELYEGSLFVNQKGQYVVKNFTNGEYCASGPKDNLIIRKGDCTGTSLEPTVTSFVVTGKTTKSVSVKVEASDDTGIVGYQYCVENCNKEESWVASKENTYTYSNLKYSREYTLYVRVINRIDRVTEKSLKATTENLAVPTYAVSPSGWATSKTVKVTYPVGYQYSYTVLEGTVKENGTIVPVGQKRTVSGTSVTLTFESNGRMKAVTSDGFNEATAADLIVSQIDTTSPTGVSVGKGTVTSKSIQVTANGVDNESGITKYEFSKDNGKTWITNSSKTYTFNNLMSGTYQIKVRLTNQVGLSSEASLSIATTSIAAPTYAVTPSGWATSKTVTVTYPTGYTNQFKVTSGTATYNGTAITNNTWVTVTGNAQVVFKSNGAITTQVTDGVNTVAGSNLTINQIDTTAPTVTSLSIASTTTAYNALTTTITSNVTDNSGAAFQMYISNSGYETGGAWENYSSSKSWNVGGSLNGTGRTIYITYKDQAGNKVNRALSYTVYNDCSNTTTTWNGVWSVCSAVCGGGTQTMSGTKYDTKTGSACGDDSKTQACNQQGCSPSLEVVSNNVNFDQIIPLNSTLAVGLKAYGNTALAKSGWYYESYVMATLIYINGTSVSLGTPVQITSGMYGAGYDKIQALRIDDTHFVVAGSSGYYNPGSSGTYGVNRVTASLIQVSGNSFSNLSSVVVFSNTAETKSFSAMGIGGANGDVIFTVYNNGGSNTHYTYAVSTGGFTYKSSAFNSSCYYRGDPQNLAQFTVCDGIRSLYAITNFGYGNLVQIKKISVLMKVSYSLYVGNTDVYDNLNGSLLTHVGNNRLIIGGQKQIDYMSNRSGSWVIEKSVTVDKVVDMLIPANDQMAILYGNGTLYKAIYP